MIDLLIIGSGGAGLSAAIEATSSGAKVAVVTKNIPTQSQTVMAQGGINAALANVEDDSVSLHISDTLKASHNLADESMVSKLCSSAKDTIEWLEKIGVPFSRIDGAKSVISSIAQRKLGGASAKRACYAQDYTGLKILHTLFDKALSMDIDILPNRILLELLFEDGVVYGGIFFNQSSGEIEQIKAKSTLIATGGFGAIYHKFTTNSYGATGDGLTAGIRAGGVASNIEFIQFHPTALKGSAILISESARGEGGYLIDDKGERFTNELAPRDEVTRAIFEKISNKESVYLDIRHLGKEKIEHLMPQELHLCRLHAGIDPIVEPIPISPAVHYTMGGLLIEKNFAVSKLENCYSVGEASEASLHGANRLGGNSLLEIIAFGRAAAREAIDNTPLNSDKNFDTKDQMEKELKSIFEKESKENIYAIREELGDLLFHRVGIVRDGDSLDMALKELYRLKERFDLAGIADKSSIFNTNLQVWLELKSALEISEALIKGAIYRKESRGAHYRKDYPMQSMAYQKPTRYILSESWSIGVDI